MGYFDEPFFQDGIIGQGIEDATANGRVLLLQRRKRHRHQRLRLRPDRFVPNDPTGSGALTAAGGNTALANTNINLANVPTALYAAGFHNFNPNGQDVAQTVNDPSTNTSTPTELQYNEPYDQTKSPNNEVLIYTQNGKLYVQRRTTRIPTRSPRR